MYNLREAYFSLFIILTLPSVCSAEGPSMPFMELILVVFVLQGLGFLLVATLIIKALMFFLKSLSRCLKKT